MDEELAGQIKQGQKVAWDAGEFVEIAKLISSVGERITRHAGVAADEEVLDVACGTGNATLPAARTGARVTGLDLVPKLLEHARAAADGEGLDVTWVEGDAEQLPFEDVSFDVVLSTFGCMFAPRHEVAAAEIARVLRPAGRADRHLQLDPRRRDRCVLRDDRRAHAGAAPGRPAAAGCGAARSTCASFSRTPGSSPSSRARARR